MMSRPKQLVSGIGVALVMLLAVNNCPNAQETSSSLTEEVKWLKENLKKNTRIVTTLTKTSNDLKVIAAERGFETVEVSGCRLVLRLKKVLTEADPEKRVTETYTTYSVPLEAIDLSQIEASTQNHVSSQTWRVSGSLESYVITLQVNDGLRKISGRTRRVVTLNGEQVSFPEEVGHYRDLEIAFNDREIRDKALRAFRNVVSICGGQD